MLLVILSVVTMSTPLTAVEDALRELEKMGAPTATKPPARAPKQAPQTEKPKRPKKKWTLKRLAWWIMIAGIGVILPFIVLVRSSVYFYQTYGWNGEMALLGAGGVAAVLLMLYAVFVNWRFRRKLRLSLGMIQVIGVVVGIYCGYAVLFLSSNNAKSAAVQETYTALHPMLRLAVSTVALVDQELVVTDGVRTLDAYAKMGLSANENSLHFVQDTGYAHAIDLRTRDRAEWQNQLVTFYFDVMGFKTLRHVGTADHLHVSLPVVR